MKQIDYLAGDPYDPYDPAVIAIQERVKEFYEQQYEVQSPPKSSGCAVVAIAILAVPTLIAAAGIGITNLLS